MQVAHHHGLEATRNRDRGVLGITDKDQGLDEGDARVQDPVRRPHPQLTPSTAYTVKRTLSEPSGLCTVFALGAGSCVDWESNRLENGATYAYRHPVQFVGLVAGGTSLVTGAGELTGGAGLLTEELLGQTSRAAGAISGGADAADCRTDDVTSCASAGIGTSTLGTPA